MLQALPKGRKFDAVVRQVTELGADRIVPVVGARSVVEVADKADRLVARWEAVARAAYHQATNWEVLRARLLLASGVVDNDIAEHLAAFPG